MNKQNKKKLIREIDFKYNLKEYWGFLSKYKVKFYLLMLLALLLSFSYVVDKYIFKELIDRGTDFADGILTKTAFINILWILIIGLLLIHSSPLLCGYNLESAFHHVEK